MSRRYWRAPGPAVVLACTALGLAVPARPGIADGLEQYAKALKPEVSAGVGIVPRNSWISGTFWSLVRSDEHFNRLRYDLEATAFTSYSVSVYFPLAGLGFGVNLDTDDSFIGEVQRLMGYLSIGGFMGRIQASTLQGTARWVNADYDDFADYPAHPRETPIDSTYLNVDLLKALNGNGGDLAIGIGFTSFRLPVQLDLQTLSADGEAASPWNWTYQEDMEFRVYSVLFGMNDPLDTVAMGLPDDERSFTRRPGLNLWLYTMDRFGLGLARVSDYEKSVIEAINPSYSLEGQDSLVMMVDIDMTLGLRWMGNLGTARIGLGLGYRLGGQMILCLPLTGSPDSSSSITAAPDFYLARGGFILKGSVSW